MISVESFQNNRSIPLTQASTEKAIKIAQILVSVVAQQIQIDVGKVRRVSHQAQGTLYDRIEMVCKNERNAIYHIVADKQHNVVRVMSDRSAIPVMFNEPIAKIVQALHGVL